MLQSKNMSIYETFEYQLIKDYYGEQTASRSQVPLINHVQEGLLILQWEKSELLTQQAYCLHPLFQSNEALFGTYQKVDLGKIDPKALLLTLEYRNIANQYLSKRRIDSFEEIQLSPLPEVNQMLIADKIQNRKDFELYHQKTHPRSQELQFYFRNWLEKLGVSEDRYQFYWQKITN